MAKRRKKKKSGLFPKLILTAFVLYSAVTLISLQLKINDQKKQNQEIAALIEQEKTKQAQLKQKNQEELNDEYIIKEAEKQGYAAPTERVFIDTSGS